MKLYDRIESIIPAPPGLVKVYAWGDTDVPGVYPVVALALVVKDDGFNEPVQAIRPIALAGTELDDPLYDEPDEYEGAYPIEELSGHLDRLRELAARKEAAEKNATGQ